MTAQFTLFGKVLTNLAPPVSDVDVKVGVASFASLVILLLVSAFVDQSKSSKRQNLSFGLIGLVLFVAAVGIFAWYENLQGDFVYRYPAEENPHAV